MIRLLRRLRHLWHLLNLPCDRISELMSRSLDERLLNGERLAYRSHLVYCSACRKLRRQLRTIRNLFRDASESQALPGMPDALRERIRQAIRAR